MSKLVAHKIKTANQVVDYFTHLIFRLSKRCRVHCRASSCTEADRAARFAACVLAPSPPSPAASESSRADHHVATQRPGLKGHLGAIDPTVRSTRSGFPEKGGNGVRVSSGKVEEDRKVDGSRLTQKTARYAAMAVARRALLTRCLHRSAAPPPHVAGDVN